MTSMRSTDQSGLRELDGRIEGYQGEEEALSSEIAFLEGQIRAFQERLASVMEQRENIASVREEMQAWVAQKRAQIQALPKAAADLSADDPTQGLKAVFAQAQVSTPLTAEGVLFAPDLPAAPGFDDAEEADQSEPSEQIPQASEGVIDLPAEAAEEALGDEIPLGFDGELADVLPVTPRLGSDDCPPGFDDSVPVSIAPAAPTKPKEGARDEFEFGF